MESKEQKIECPFCGGQGVYEDAVSETSVITIVCRPCKGTGVKQ